MSLWTFLDNFFFSLSMVIYSPEWRISPFRTLVNLVTFLCIFPTQPILASGDWSGTWLMIILWAYMDSPDILIAVWWLFFFLFSLFCFLTIPNVWFDSQWQRLWLDANVFKYAWLQAWKGLGHGSMPFPSTSWTGWDVCPCQWLPGRNCFPLLSGCCASHVIEPQLIKVWKS